MKKGLGKAFFPLLMVSLLALFLSGCGTKSNIQSGSANSMGDNIQPGSHTATSSGRDMGGVSGAVSGATGTGSINALTSSLYRIGPEDLLRVSVWNNKDLTLDISVRPDGKISLPLIHDVHAEGLTPPELAGIIQQNLLQYIKDPHVSVIVLEVNASKFYVVGEVKKPGTYFLRGETSVLQALSMAGGFTTFASPKNIRLVRNIDGNQAVRVINYFQVIENGSSQNYLILPGDTLVVP